MEELIRIDGAKLEALIKGKGKTFADVGREMGFKGRAACDRVWQMVNRQQTIPVERFDALCEALRCLPADLQPANGHGKPPATCPDCGRALIDGAEHRCPTKVVGNCDLCGQILFSDISHNCGVKGNGATAEEPAEMEPAELEPGPGIAEVMELAEASWGQAVEPGPEPEPETTYAKVVKIIVHIHPRRVAYDMDMAFNLTAADLERLARIVAAIEREVA